MLWPSTQSRFELGPQSSLTQGRLPFRASLCYAAPRDPTWIHLLTQPPSPGTSSVCQSRDRKVTEGCALSGWPPTLFLHSTGPSLHVTPTPQQRKPGKASVILWEDEGVESIDPVSIRVSSSPSCRTHEALPQRRHPSFPHHLLSIRLRYDLLVLAKETKTTNCQPRTTYTRTGEVRDNPRGWVRDTQLPLCQDKAEIPLTGHTGGRPLWGRGI